MREKLNALFKRRRAYAQLRLESTSIPEIRELEKAIDDFTIRIQITEKKIAEQRSKAILITKMKRHAKLYEWEELNSFVKENLDE